MDGMKKINVKMESELKNVTLLELTPKDTSDVSTLNSKRLVSVESPCSVLLEILELTEELILIAQNPTLTHLSLLPPHSSPPLEPPKLLMLLVKPTCQEVDHLDVKDNLALLAELKLLSALTKLTSPLEEDSPGLPQCQPTNPLPSMLI